MTPSRDQENTGGGIHTGQKPIEHTTSQAEALEVLLSLAVGPQRHYPDGPQRHYPEGTGMRDGRARAVLETPAPEQDAAGSLPEARWEPRAGRARPGGRHAATRPPYLDRRGARFVVFSAIGGSVFLMGLGVQAVLTGMWHLSPLVSYLIQAVVSVETSFLLNRWLTWRDRGTPFWTAFARFNAQKTVTIILNLALYAGLLWLGMNYLVANVVLTAVFTVVNYVAGDRLVFIPGKRPSAEPAAPAAPSQVKRHPAAQVSAVIPCRGNERTIGAAVQSLLDQDYPGLREIMLVGSPGDSTWKGLAGVAHPRLTLWELKTPPGVRDANFKRDAAVRMTSGELIALVDSDIVLESDWMSRAVAELENSGASCVAGGMKSFHDSFWGRYTDSTWIGAKTPRVPKSYTVTSANFGARGRKPPILANTLFARQLYERCPIDPLWSHGSYEDYEWFWRATKAGYPIRVCRDLFGWHHHRRGLRALAREYRRSSRGCAYFIRAHPDSPLAKRRRRQALVLPLAAAAGIAGATAAAAEGYGRAVAGLLLGGAAMLAIHQAVRSRNLESVAYPVVGLTLGLVFTAGLVSNLIRPGTSAAAAAPSTASATRRGKPASGRRRFLPIAAICAVQAGLSLTLVWSNTAYIDEADYLWVGRLELAHWLHGTSWPSAYAYHLFSGSPLIYPPLGALADSADGLAGARLLSLAFMLTATVLLYLTASRLIGRTGALFAAALWAVSEPAMRLAFATFDPLAVLLTTLSAWLIVQAGWRRHRGELVAAAAVALALANVTAYSSIVIDPVVIAFAFLVWRTRMPVQQSLSCAAWLAGACALAFAALMTASHSWIGLSSTVFSPNAAGYQTVSPVLSEIWGYSGLIIGLAIIGAVITLQSERRNHAALIGGLFFTAYLVMQFHDQTSWTIDKHLAYGMWFAAIAAGYACSKLIRWFPGSRRKLVVLCCAAALAYPAVTSWQSAWQRYHAWPNAGSFISSLESLSSRTNGLIYVPAHEANIAEYYTRQGNDWARWSGNLSLDSARVAPGASGSYFNTQLHSGKYGLIVLFYSTTFSSGGLPRGLLLSAQSSNTNQDLLNVVGENSNEQGLPALTRALEGDPDYYAAAHGTYNTSNISGTHDYGIYVIWKLKVRT